MANNKAKTWERHDHNLKLVKNGRLFIGPVLSDLSKVKVVWAGVDTVRQLYKGFLRPDVLALLESDSEVRGVLWDRPLDLKWHLSRAPYHSGYKYKLQNNDWGAVILIKSFYKKADLEGTHLKIELSPHMISQRGVKQVQDQLNMIAYQFLETGFKAHACAVHLAADVQGWDTSEDFFNRFSTRARTFKKYNGVSDVDISLSEIATAYGDNETYTFGMPNALQFSTYRKDKEVLRSDKLDYMLREWDIYSMGEYEREKPVRRIEVRFHHSVIAEVAEGLEVSLSSFAEVADHLSDLWRYALKRNRLDYSSSYVDPFWQLLMEDVEFYHPANGLYIWRKKKEEVTPIGRNYSQITGHMISIAARMHWRANHLVKQLEKLDFFDDMLRWYRERGWDRGQWYEDIENKLALRRLIGKAA